MHVRMLGTDATAFARRAPYPEDGVTLAVGRLIEKKGFHVLIEAAARRDVGPVRIVGDGPWRERLSAAIRERRLQDRVQLAGSASPAEIRDWMERAALLVVPSVIAADGDRDALPVVIWEALAMELPVVGTTVAGLPEVILPPWGRLVAPGDADALADAIAAWRAAPAAERARAGRAGRAWLQAEHRQDQAVGRLIDLIAGV
jgi:glycosyltransferase involved in cell wall biosynthesis